MRRGAVLGSCIGCLVPLIVWAIQAIQFPHGTIYSPLMQALQLTLWPVSLFLLAAGNGVREFLFVSVAVAIIPSTIN